MKILLIVLLVILLVAIVGLVVFVVVKKKKQGGNQSTTAAQPQSRGRESKRGRSAKGKRGRPAPEPEAEDTSFLFEEEQQADATPQPSLQDIVEQQQQQVQDQSEYQNGTETLKRRTGSIETIATELIQEMANAISQSNITALTSCVREPLLQPLATSIYNMRQNGIARDLSFKSIKEMRVVSTSLIGDNEFYILTADVEFTDYLIRGNEIIGVQELVYSKKLKVVVTQDITVNGAYSLTNINI